jgi:hypothetical protein
MPVRPSVHMEQLGSKRKEYQEIYLGIFRLPVEKIQRPIKPDQNNGYFA